MTSQERALLCGGGNGPPAHSNFGGNKQGDNGVGNGGDDGVPGKSGKPDENR